jgi:cytochrome c-type biogenesis protein CcmE
VTQQKNSGAARIVVASLVILAVVVYLAWTGVQSNKSYYVTIAELQGMGNKAYSRHLRVEGFVKPDSIVTDGPHATFILTPFESHSAAAAANTTPQTITVRYEGAEPPPDTFKNDAMALAIGTYGRDGVFHATQLQAKCASKYAPPAAGAAPAATASTQSSAPAAQ